jgi:hypothetical protein
MFNESILGLWWYLPLVPFSPSILKQYSSTSSSEGSKITIKIYQNFGKF